MRDLSLLSFGQRSCAFSQRFFLFTSTWQVVFWYITVGSIGFMYSLYLVFFLLKLYFSSCLPKIRKHMWKQIFNILWFCFLQGGCSFQLIAPTSDNIGLHRYNLIRQNLLDPNCISCALGKRNENGWLAVRHQTDVIYGLFSRALSWPNLIQ